MNRNEMVGEMAPLVRKAIRNFNPADGSHYLDGYYGSHLVPVLAKKFGLPETQISSGYGIEFFLRSIFDSCIPGKDIILSESPQYSFYSRYAKVRNIRFATVPLIDRGDRFIFDVNAMVSAIRQWKPRIVLLNSPNNPTGCVISVSEIGRIMKAANKKTLVVLDEAYLGFSKSYDERKIISLTKQYPNIVILRSFSKYYGLAGLRIGFALWGKHAKKMARYDDLYLGGSCILEDVALAAIASESFSHKRAQQLIKHRGAFITRMNRLKYFKAYQSEANFVLVKVHPIVRDALEKKLQKLPAAISKFVLPHFMRVSLGSFKDIAPFVRILEMVDNA